MIILKLEGVSQTVAVRDSTPLTILDGVDLTLNAGDRVSIVGRSGSGKSTLLNLLGLLDLPTSGTVEFLGQSANRYTTRQRDRIRGDQIGFIFQQFNLLPGRTAIENVMMPLLYAGGNRFWNRRAIAATMLSEVGLGHRLDTIADRLSGGEQQRVAIARALVRSPRLILADEPTGALDFRTGQTVMEAVEAVATQKGAALAVITHDPVIAARYSDTYRLETGVLTPKSLLEPREPSTA